MSRALAERLLPAYFAERIELSIAVAAYMAASAGMMIINKLVLRGSRLPITICGIQLAFTVATLCAVPDLRRSLHFGSRADAWRWARAVPLLFAIMIVSSMLALDYASMGALVVMRNLAPVPALVAEMTIDQQMKVDSQTALAILLSVAGVLLYAKNDLHSSPAGLVFMGVNLCAAVVERLVQRKLIALEPIDLSKTSMMLLNNGVGALLLLPIIGAFGEAAHWDEFGTFSAARWALLLLSCINGVAISYAGIHVQRFVSASTFLVLTNTNKFGIIAFGIVVLREARAWQAVLGCVVALAGGVWYGKARSDLEQRPAAAAAADGQPTEEDGTPADKAEGTQADKADGTPTIRQSSTAR